MMNFSAGERTGSNRETTFGTWDTVLALRLHLDVRKSKGKNTCHRQEQLSCVQSVYEKWKCLTWALRLFCLKRLSALGFVHLIIRSFYPFSLMGKVFGFFFFSINILFYFSKFLVVLGDRFPTKLFGILISFQDQWLFGVVIGKAFESSGISLLLAFKRESHTKYMIVFRLVKSL